MHFVPYDLDPMAYNLIEKWFFVKRVALLCFYWFIFSKICQHLLLFFVKPAKISKLSNAKDAQKHFKSVFEQPPKKLLKILS